MILTIDPGIRASGIALWGPKGELSRAGLVRIAKSEQNPRIKMAILIDAWIYPDRPTRAIVEFPQTYAGRASRGDANDLLALAGLVGAIDLAINNEFSIYPEFVRPSEWKGQRPKEVTKANALVKLSNEELERVDLKCPASLQHNVWDAIGIGLSVLKKERA